MCECLREDAKSDATSVRSQCVHYLQGSFGKEEEELTPSASCNEVNVTFWYKGFCYRGYKIRVANKNRKLKGWVFGLEAKKNKTVRSK